MVLPVPVNDCCSYLVPVYNENGRLIAKIPEDGVLPENPRQFEFQNGARNTREDNNLSGEARLLEPADNYNFGWLGEKPRFAWRCRRKTRPHEELCLFHQSPDERSISDPDLAQLFLACINDSLRERIPELLLDQEDWDEEEPKHLILDIIPPEGESVGGDMASRRKTQFIGASFGDLELSYEDLNAPGNYPIDIRGASVDKFDLRKAIVRHELRCQSIAADRVDFHGAALHKSIYFQKAVVEDGVQFENTLSRGDIGMSKTDIRGGVGFEGAEISGSVYFWRTEIVGNLNFNHIRVDGTVNLFDAKIDKDVSLLDAEIMGDASLRNAKVGGRVDLRVGEIRGYANLENVKVKKTGPLGGVTLSGAKIGEYVELLDAKLCGEINLLNADVSEDVTLRGAKIGESVYLKEAAIGEEINLNNAEVGGDVNIRDVAVGEGVDLGIAKIGGEMKLGGAEIDEDANFECAIVGGNSSLDEASIGGNVNFKNADVGGAISLYSTDICGNCSFSNTSVIGPVDLSGISVNGKFHLDVGGLEHPGVDSIILRNSSLASGVFSQSIDDNGRDQRDGVVYDLQSATIGDVTINEPQTSDNHSPIFEHARFVETKYTNFPFNKNRQDFHTIKWNLDGLGEHGREDVARVAAMVGKSPLGSELEHRDDQRTAVEVALDQLEHISDATTVQELSKKLHSARELSELREIFFDDEEFLPSDSGILDTSISSENRPLWVDDPVNQFIKPIKSRIRDLLSPTNQHQNSSGRYTQIGSRLDEISEAKQVAVVLQAWKEDGMWSPTQTARNHVDRLSTAREDIEKEDEVGTAALEDFESDVIERFRAWFKNDTWAGVADVDIVDELTSELNLTVDVESLEDALWYPSLRLWNELELELDWSNRSYRARALNHALKDLRGNNDDAWKYSPEKSARTIFDGLTIAVADSMIYEADSTPIEERKLDLDTLEATYAMAKKGADEQGENAAASSFFYREMKYVRLQHWQEFRQSIFSFGAALLGRENDSNRLSGRDASGANDDDINPGATAMGDGGKDLESAPDGEEDNPTEYTSRQSASNEDAANDVREEDDSVDANLSKAEKVEDRAQQAEEEAWFASTRWPSVLRHGWNILRYFWAWLLNVVLWAVTGYGEKSSHVVITSTLVVLFWAFGFFAYDTLLVPSGTEFATGPYGGGNISYLILSLESFVTLILTSPTGLSPGLHVMALIEGFLGVFLLGVFVVTLTRSVHR